MTRLRLFHGDERGKQSIQVVLILAIAALVLLVLKLFWYDIKNWVAPALAALLGRWE